MFNVHTFFSTAIIITPENGTVQPCAPNPCDPNASCDTYGNQFVVCETCNGPDSINNHACRPQCILNSDCGFDTSCINNRCVDPCPGSCGVNAECTVYYHDPICRCADGLVGNPYEHCKQPSYTRELKKYIICLYQLTKLVNS